jgi:voltage-gated potassium channel
VAIIVESFEDLWGPVVLFLRVFEYLSVALFSLEYILQFWAAPDRFPRAKHPCLKYALSPMAVLDLFAVAPFYLSLLIL